MRASCHPACAAKSYSLQDCLFWGHVLYSRGTWRGTLHNWFRLVCTLNLIAATCCQPSTYVDKITYTTPD